LFIAGDALARRLVAAGAGQSGYQERAPAAVDGGEPDPERAAPAVPGPYSDLEKMSSRGAEKISLYRNSDLR